MKLNEIKAPFLPYDEIRNFAKDFLGKYNTEDEIPAPIDKIAEFKLKIQIIPTEARFILGVEGWISNDFSCIYVDKKIFNDYDNRYYFTIAHEIGHLFLHRDIYEEFYFSDIEEWKKIIYSISPKVYGWLEKHAYDFAGLVLVPEEHLCEKYQEAVLRVEKEGFEREEYSDIFDEYVSNYLTKHFCVSADVIRKRIKYDKLK